MAKLTRNVWVVPYSTMAPVFLAAGTSDEDENAYLVTNASVWDSEPHFKNDDDAIREENRAAAPPRTGKGSTRKAWVEFAEDFYSVEDDETKEDIISTLEEREVI